MSLALGASVETGADVTTRHEEQVGGVGREKRESKV
jgi:hypothetical protein